MACRPVGRGVCRVHVRPSRGETPCYSAVTWELEEHQSGGHWEPRAGCPPALPPGDRPRASGLLPAVFDPQLPELPLSLTVASGWGSPASPLAPLCFFLGVAASEGDGMGSSMDGRGCGLTSCQLDGDRLHHGVPAPSCGRQRPAASRLWKSPFPETCVPQKRSPRRPWCSH